MKWFFAMNSASLSRYDQLIKVAVESAIQNTDLEPHFLFDGLACEFTAELESRGVTVHFGPSSLASELDRRPETDGYSASTARGAYLRLEIPTIETVDEFVLYTDVDVMFCSNFDWGKLKPKILMAAGEYDSSKTLLIQSDSVFNSGVMIMNVAECRRQFPKFRDFIRSRNFFFHGVGGFYDQGALNAYFGGQFDVLPNELNYRVFAAEDVVPVIIHFHGPKPEEIRKMISGSNEVYPVLQNLYKRNASGYEVVLRKYQNILDGIFAQ